jgi:transcriptional regulator with XRE-family HTH domain
MTAEEFRTARTSLGLSQKDMAEKLGMGRHGWQTISGWENGHKLVPPTVDVTIALLLQQAA